MIESSIYKITTASRNKKKKKKQINRILEFSKIARFKINI